MKDILDQINSVSRSLGTKTIPAGDGPTLIMQRTYDADIKDVWDALTSPERISRWFLPITGDLRLGGSYQLKGNASGDVLECEPPRRFKVTWVFGENVTEKDISEVEVRLDADANNATRLVLEHAAVVPPEMWDQFGPGAGGVGWDLGLVALGWHLSGIEFDVETWENGPEAKQATIRSAQAWGEASLAAGEDADKVAKQVAGTTAFYTGG